MSFDEIMLDITKGLTGDSDIDMAYLKSQMEKYKDHELHQEILRACGRMMFEVLPENKRKELSDALDKNYKAWYATLDEVRFNRFKNHNEKALELIDGLVNKIETLLKAGFFAEDSVSQYFCFEETFEEILYCTYFEPKKEIRRPDNIPIAAVYLEYGSLLVDLGRIQDANEALAKALKWNPVRCKILFEYAETYKMMGKIEDFYRISLDSFRYAYHKKDVARCYRNMGYYFVEKELWDVAVGCYFMSLRYERDCKNAQSELYYIASKAKDKVHDPSREEMEKFSNQYGFPLNLAPSYISYTFGKEALEHKNFKLAQYLLEIAYDLTEIEEIKQMLETIPVE